MEVLKVIWWQHNRKAAKHSSAKVPSTLTAYADDNNELSSIDNLQPEEIDGL
jgi:CRISPR-associated protein Csd2